MVPLFGPSYGPRFHPLLCPSCNNEYLHQERTEVFERGEDDKHGVHVIVENLQAAVDTKLAGNPSPRRHGLSIHFWCESCDAKPVLIIYQHKGLTCVDFQLTTADPPHAR